MRSGRALQNEAAEQLRRPTKRKLGTAGFRQRPEKATASETRLGAVLDADAAVDDYVEHILRAGDKVLCVLQAGQQACKRRRKAKASGEPPNNMVDALTPIMPPQSLSHTSGKRLPSPQPLLPADDFEAARTEARDCARPGLYAPNARDTLPPYALSLAMARREKADGRVRRAMAAARQANDWQRVTSSAAATAGRRACAGQRLGSPEHDFCKCDAPEADEALPDLDHFM